MKFYIEVDDKRLRDRLGRFAKGLNTEIPKTVIAAAEFAKQVAINNVPRDTRRTLGGIKGIVAIQGNGVTEARVGFFQPMMRGQEGSQLVDLPKFMTYSKLAISGWHPYGNKNLPLTHFKNGNPRFLELAANMAFSKFKKDVEVNTSALLHK